MCGDVDTSVELGGYGFEDGELIDSPSRKKAKAIEATAADAQGARNLH